MVFSLVLALQVSNALSCPAMGTPVGSHPAEIFDYEGIRFETCCSGCESDFKAHPAESLKKQAEAGKVIGTFLFDPVSGKRTHIEKAVATSDYQGVRYPFTSIEHKDVFDAKPDAYTKLPKQEALVCAVLNQDVKTPAQASGYVDYKGNRFYLCCTDCLEEMSAAPEKYAKNVTLSIPKFVDIVVTK